MSGSQNDRGIYGNRETIINDHFFAKKESQDYVLSNEHCNKSQYWIDFMTNI